MTNLIQCTQTVRTVTFLIATNRIIKQMGSNLCCVLQEKLAIFYTLSSTPLLLKSGNAIAS